MAIFQESLLFPRILASLIKEKDILSMKMSFKIEFRPPAEQNLAFLHFTDNIGQNILEFFGNLSFFKNESSDENLNFALSIGFNRIFQLGRVSLTSRLYFQPFWTFQNFWILRS